MGMRAIHSVKYILNLLTKAYYIFIISIMVSNLASSIKHGIFEFSAKFRQALMTFNYQRRTHPACSRLYCRSVANKICIKLLIVPDNGPGRLKASPWPTK